MSFDARYGLTDPDDPHRAREIAQEEMLRRYTSHIPACHFKMVRYYGFLANRKRGTLLPRVYKVLEMEVRTKPVKPGFRLKTRLKRIYYTKEYTISCPD